MHAFDPRGFKVLLVDDEPRNLMVLSKILKKAGYAVSSAGDGREALDMVLSLDFDLVLLDVMMPEMDGFEVCRQLKLLPRYQEVPVIFITAKAQLESIVEGFELGAVDYVTKPFHARELLARVRTHLRLKQTTAELQVALAAKNKFFSIISHDLKSPINSLSGISSLVLHRGDRADKEELLRYAKNLNDTSRNLSRLLGNLIDWSRMQTGRMEWFPDHIELAPLAQEALSLLAPTAEAKSINLVSEIPPKLIVFADKNMVSAVLRNLVENGIKYTGEGGEVKLHSGGLGDMAEITVTDTGRGIDPEALEDLFRIDVRTSRPGTHKERGTGLGLILCKEFVEVNQGAIRVESQIGKGSQFIFTLPKRPISIEDDAPLLRENDEES